MSEPDRTQLIYHIAKENDWRRALEEGQYKVNSLEKEGFIHCSTRFQVVRTANLLYAGQTDVVVLEIDPTRLTHELRYDAAPDGELFPHIYGPIFIDEVNRVVAFHIGDHGQFVWPGEEDKTP